MVKRAMMFTTVFGLMLVLGCANMQKYVVGGAAVGAAAGAAVGGLWGANAGGINAGEGALAGAAAGGLAGALIGDAIDKGTDEAANEELRTQIADLQSENQVLKNKLQASQADLAACERRCGDLERQLANLRKSMSNARMPLFEISLTADVLFNPGSAVLSKNGRAELDKAAQQLAEHKGKFVMVEGHTDSQPIRASNWKSNWELGAARALTVLHFLEDKGVDPAMLSAGTFSQYQPVADNNSKEGMAQNRRAAIVVYSGWPNTPKR